MFSGKRLRIRREDNHLSQSDIAHQLGINRSSYNSWESGRAKPNHKNLILLSKILDIETTYFESEYNIVNNYLQLNEENKTIADEYAEVLLQTQQEKENKVVSFFAVEVLSDIQLSARPGEGFFDEFETETVYSDEEQYGYDIATWITGHSMEPVYQDGEVALIREGGFDYDGAVYAVTWNEQLYIKKVYLEDNGFRLVSINKDFPDKFAPAEDEPRIVGKIVGNFMPIEQ